MKEKTFEEKLIGFKIYVGTYMYRKTDKTNFKCTSHISMGILFFEHKTEIP